MQDENLIIIKNSYIKFYGGTSPLVPPWIRACDTYLIQ